MNSVKDFPSLKLKIIGQAQEKYVENVVKKHILQFQDNVELCGFKISQEIAEEFKSALMVVVPSHMENSPNVVCEAMVAGVPVIASNVGGIPSIITHSETGLLVEPKNPRALAKTMRYLIEHPDIARKIAENAKRIARKRHHPDYVTAQVLEAYRQVLKMEKR